ncbi:DnaB-like helicase N-terminal domain-containing protein [Streptomyces sp. NPDC090994]|uniref:DnaB-like helicase N-terminal domain-containing protein n=1 Tax=Streptomyces sp. NPDC090994 TaxID=3365969 RepID=UPI003804FD8D
MPHTSTPEPDEDDLYAVPPPQPVFHVEQALLGAFLLDPHRLDDVNGIAADSFSTAAHAALYAAISTVPRPDPAGHAKNTKWLDRVLATGREQARGLTASYLHTLVQVCPWPSHAPAYARMVEAEHARRRLLTAAEHLVHTAHDVCLPHPVQPVLAEADALAAVVDDIANRFPPRSGVLPRTPAPPSVWTTAANQARSCACWPNRPDPSSTGASASCSAPSWPRPSTRADASRRTPATPRTPPSSSSSAPAIRAGPPTTTAAHAARSTRATR